MRWLYYAILFVAFAACSPERTRTDTVDLDAVTMEILELDRKYKDSKIDEAEQALLDFLHLLAERQMEGAKGYDFLFVSAMTHGRLYLLYRTKGDTDAAERHYMIANREYAAWRRHHHLPEVTFSQESFAQLIEKYDGPPEPHWKGAPSQ